MAITINWATKVINVPQVDLTDLGGGLYELNVNTFRLTLKDLEDDEAGIPFLRTHNHNTQVTVGGVTLSRVIEIINGYTITFQDTGSPYTVKCTGANHNIGDVKTVNQVSLIVGNTAGLITVTSGSGVTEQDKLDIVDRIWDEIRTGHATAGSFGQYTLAELSANGRHAVVDELNAETYDTRTFSEIMKDLLSMAAGRIVEDPDSTYTFYERDNTTPRYVLTKTGNERVRS